MVDPSTTAEVEATSSDAYSPVTRLPVFVEEMVADPVRFSAPVKVWLVAVSSASKDC